MTEQIEPTTNMTDVNVNDQPQQTELTQSAIEEVIERAKRLDKHVEQCLARDNQWKPRRCAQLTPWMKFKHYWWRIANALIGKDV